MKSCAMKYVAIFLILLATKCIDAQEALNVEVASQLETGEGVEGKKSNIIDVSMENTGTDESKTESTLRQETKIEEHFKEQIVTRAEAQDVRQPVTAMPIENDAWEFSEPENSGDSTQQNTYCKCDCETGIIIDDKLDKNCHEQPITDETTTESDTVTESILQSTVQAYNEDTTNADIELTPTPTQSAEVSTTGNELAEEDATTTATETKPIAPLTTCLSAGDFPHETDCHSYITCSLTAAGLERTDGACPSKSAFNIELGRCTRDISSCDDGVECLTAGSFADSQNNASYYWCVPRLQGGLRKYHVDCNVGKVFVPQLGKCFIDINNLQNLPTNYGQDNGLPDDEDIVKAELKQFKAAEKVKLKEQKLKDKLEKKLQKQLAKKAAKEAKELAKEKNNSKEKESFVCTQEGNFASSMAEDRYFSCISKKGKFKVVSLSCPLGHKFEELQGVCIAASTKAIDKADD